MILTWFHFETWFLGIEWRWIQWDNQAEWEEIGNVVGISWDTLPFDVIKHGWLGTL